MVRHLLTTFVTMQLQECRCGAPEEWMLPLEAAIGDNREQGGVVKYTNKGTEYVIIDRNTAAGSF
jgi:hypothetical protein